MSWRPKNVVAESLRHSEPFSGNPLRKKMTLDLPGLSLKRVAHPVAPGLRLPAMDRGEVHRRDVLTVRVEGHLSRDALVVFSRRKRITDLAAVQA